ncbi:uncharacterized protein hmgxb4b isoform X4 [Larimichthys crocea]|uniref:uncharacterized protein hmgxb4b isoform X4 n=1 Tax=Larimichthys crocea TaxID=215358 RepID=UPI000F5DA166|nr:uncharacterized protein LOC109141980 isoform X4 [Larimichthys crocea]
MMELSLNLMEQSPPPSSLCIQTDGGSEERRTSRRTCCIHVAQQRATLIRTVTPPSSPVTGRPRLFIPSSPCSPSGSPWDTPPVSAAAHLHLLGESLSLIGHHLQETDKMVSVPGSLSLLLDSLLCALAPLICLTTEIPELRSCTQHTLSSTLENISYVMPGMELCGRVVQLNNMVVLEEILCSVSSQERLECNFSLLFLLKQPGTSLVAGLSTCHFVSFVLDVDGRMVEQ